MEQKKLITGIAVAVALAFFIAVYGASFFPNVPLVRYFSALTFGPQLGDVQSGSVEEQAAGPVVEVVPGLLQVQDLEEGTGLLAQEGSEVAVKYRLVVNNEEAGGLVVVDENFSKDGYFSFVVGSNQVIPGFSLGVAGMREEGRRLIQVAPALGYGDREIGNIPANSVLVFEVLLHEVK